MSDWERRQLCPDGACVGVIGDNGMCKVCGRAAQKWGDERRRGLLDDDAESADAAADADADADDDDDDDDYEDGDEDGDDGGDEDDDEDEDEDEVEDDEAATDDVAASSSDAGPTGEWDGRKLCPDGGCVGVVGDDGKCKVCGRSAA